MPFKKAIPEVAFLKVGLYGNTGSGKCTVAQTFVLTPEGFQMIGTLGKNKPMNLLPWKQTLALFRDKEVETSHFYKERVNEVLNITTRHGYSLGATINHPILTWTSDCKFEFKRLGNLAVGDVAVIARGTETFRKELFSLTSLLSFQEKIQSVRGVILPKKVTTDLATLLGYFVADGNFSTQTNTLFFSSTKTWFKEDVVQIAQGMGIYPTKSQKGACGALTDKKLFILFKGIFNYPESFTAHHKFVPDCILQSPKDVQVKFLRALIDCDGWKDKTKAFEYYTASEQLATQVHLMLLNLGIIASKSYRDHSNIGEQVYNHKYWTVRISGLDLQKYFEIIGSKKYETPNWKSEKRNSDIDSIPFLKKRLQADIQLWRTQVGWKKNGMMEKFPGRFPKFPIVQHNCGMTYETLEKFLFTFRDFKKRLDFSLYEELVFSGFHFDPVITIEVEREVQTVYDVHVPKTHAFWGNGFINHNTFTSLRCATALGRTLILDTEQSGSLYAPKEGRKREIELPSYDREATKSIVDITKHIVTAYEEGYTAVIIDQLGHLWENAQDTVLAAEERAGTKAWHKYNATGTILPMLWKKIKGLWKRFIETALDTPIHTFMCGRLQPLIEIKGGGAEVKRLGDKMAGEKEVMYEPTLLFKMERMVGNNVKAMCQKDKTGHIQGEMFVNPTIHIFKGVLDYIGKGAHIQGPKGIALKIETEDAHPAVKLLTNLALKAGFAQTVITATLQGLNLQEMEATKIAAFRGDFPLFTQQKKEEEEEKKRAEKAVVLEKK